MTYYVPFPEADALTAFDTINTAASSPITTYVSIAAIGDGTVIWYDHWEDGYEKAHHLNTPIQATTQIWGDGNPANGYPPGITNDIIRAGTVILLYNTVDPSNPGAVDYDARDKIVANRAIAVTRTYWAGGSGTLMAGSVETYDTSKWGTDYRVPVGQNIPDGSVANDGDHQMFEYTALSVMAAEDGTTVFIDADNSGTYEITNTLNEGQSYFLNGGVSVGGRVTSTKPIQVLMFTGDVGSNYETRDSTLLPVSLWSNSYYTPVATASGNGTRVWLYNPGASSITVNYRYRVGAAVSVTTNTAAVAAGSYASVLLTDGSGTEFYTTGSPAPVFYAYSTTDSDTTNTGDNQAWDWSFTLVAKPLLTPQVLVGLGIGRDPTSATNPTENGNPIWVTTVGNGQSNATVYVDYNGDNAGPYTDPNGNRYDTNLVARELQPLKIYDPDGDQTAMLIYVLSTNVSLAAAWGQDPTTASQSAPGLDAGTAVPPVDVFDVSKTLALVTDSDGDGQLGPGERVSYTINIGNTSRAPVPADVIVQDALPADTAYVAGSTAYRTSTNGTWVAVSDDSSGTAFPLDGAGFRIKAAIPVNGAFSVRFQADVNAYAGLTPGRASIINTGSVTAVVYNRTLPFKNETYLHGSLGDRVWNDANANGVQDAGESGINGVIVYLDSNTNGVRDANERYSVTSGDGYYLLTNALIEAGTHVVRVDRSTLSSDYVQTYDLDGTASADAATVALAAGQDRLDVDFGYQILARLGDFVWVDTNGNGQQDVGEPGLPDVVIRLYSTNSVVMATVTSSAAGAYAFTGLPAGTYTVGFTPPSGYLFTASNVGSDASDSDPLAGAGWTAAVTLTGGQTNLTVDAGFYLPASLAGSVFIDANGNGAAEAADTNTIAGVSVLLFDAASNVVATAVTSAQGDYLFSGLAPGVYTAVQALPPGYTNTLDVTAPNDLRIPRALTSGQNAAGNNFYDARTGSAAAQNKVLYLSDPAQALDRVDPVASGDNTATNTVTLGARAAQAVAVDATSSQQGSTVSSLTFSHTTGTGNNRLMLVAVSVGATTATGTAPTTTGVTYGGTPLTLVGSQMSPATGTAQARSYIYRLTNPPSGSANVVVSLSGNGTITAGATTFTGVDQAAPLGTAATAYGATATASVTVSSAADQLVFGSVAYDSSPTLSLPTGSGQTLAWNRTITTPANTLAGAASTEPGAVSVTHSYSSTEAQDWAIVAVPVMPAASSGGIVATFTQAPAFALPFNMASGATVVITNYVNVISGSMPAKPAVAISLSAGGMPFFVLTNATYNSGAGTLVWSGALPSAVAIAAGQALSLSVSNAQSGVTFQIRYDSATYPSKIILPTSSIIAVPSVAVYDAAYPNGLPVTLSPAESVRYVRVVVTDPFGAYDINGVALEIDSKGKRADESVSLTDAHVVASNAWSKTYEYAWQTTRFGDDYVISATAAEGTEGIRAQGSTLEQLYSAAVQGYLFVDRNGDAVRNSGDASITNVPVYLFARGEIIAATNTDVSGYYYFRDVPPGQVRILTPLLSGSSLVGTPSVSDVMRNRATLDSGDAVVAQNVSSGDLVLAGGFEEPLNFGFSVYPLSTALDVSVYASGSGVRVDVWTVNEAGHGDLVIYAWISNAWVEVGRKPGSEIVGEGSHRYTVVATGLDVNGAYLLKIVDEAGHVHYSNGTVAVQAIRIGAVRRLDMRTLTFAFNTVPGNQYRVQVSTDLVNWTDEYVSYPTARGWSEFDNAPFTAGAESTRVRLPVNGVARAFYKVVRVEQQ